MDQHSQKIAAAFVSVREALASGLEEIMTLRDENKALKEQVALMKQTESRLQEAVKQAMKKSP